MLVGLGLASTARAERGGGSLVGFGLGPAPRLGGPLAAIYNGRGVVGRLRMGGRVGHVGFELTGTIMTLAGGGLDRPQLVLATPSLAYHVVDHPWAQLAIRAGLGYGAIVGEIVRPAPPCRDEPPCATTEVEAVSHALGAAEVGVTAQLHLGRRRGGRAVVSVDVGLAQVRVQQAEQVVAGRALFITFGVAHGMAF